ncbi:unnamed protein product, partial [Gongylonema pulchrum]|uniref:SERPIN domain-containing protein n=1 Tax=Gongylonema pulchrum TaxID=637853 RepID=A0A183E099_9BILA
MDEVQADFALNLLKAATRSSESAVISPFSAALALTMTYVGAVGQTDEEFVDYISTLFADVNSAEKGVTLDAANRLYVEENFILEEAFLKIIASHFAGQLQQVHFMYKEVVVHTRDKIKNLVCVENIHDDTRLMLINAVYFKGTWKEQFRKELTRMKPFYISENNQKEVDMMAMKEKFSYYEDDDVQVLGMPYVGGQTQMHIILPQRRFGLADFEQNLTGKKLLSYVQRSCVTEVEVELPRFKLENRLELVKALQKLGMKEAFTDFATFDGISEQPLKIS